MLLKSKCSCKLGCNRGKPGAPAHNQQFSDTILDPVRATYPAANHPCLVCPELAIAINIKFTSRTVPGCAHKHCSKRSLPTILFESLLQTLLIYIHCSFASTAHLHSLLICILIARISLLLQTLFLFRLDNNSTTNNQKSMLQPLTHLTPSVTNTTESRIPYSQTPNPHISILVAIYQQLQHKTQPQLTPIYLPQKP